MSAKNTTPTLDAHNKDLMRLTPNQLGCMCDSESSLQLHRGSQLNLELDRGEEDSGESTYVEQPTIRPVIPMVGFLLVLEQN